MVGICLAGEGGRICVRLFFFFFKLYTLNEKASVYSFWVI